MNIAGQRLYLAFVHSEDKLFSLTVTHIHCFKRNGSLCGIMAFGGMCFKGTEVETD